MKRFVIAAIAALVVAAAFLMAYDLFVRSPKIRHAVTLDGARLGKPGPHSPHYRLKELPLRIHFDRTESRVISRQDNGRIIAWDIETGKSTLVAETDGLFAYCRAEDRVLISGEDGVLLIDLAPPQRRPLVAQSYRHAAWGQDCATAAFAAADRRTVDLWDMRELKRVASVATARPVRNGLAMSDDGRFVAVAEGTYSNADGHRTAVEVFEVAESALTRAARLQDDRTILGMWTMTFAPGSRDLLVGAQVDARSGLRNFVPDDGSVRWSQDGFASYWVRALAASPTGGFCVTGDEKGWLRGWDVETGEKLFERQSGLVIQTVAFSEDGTRLAVALWDSTIVIVDVETLLGGRR